MTVRSLATIASFHAHIYYDPAATRPVAERLRTAVGERFLVRLGHWHDQPVGPHDRAMFQISFATTLFGTLVPWLMLNHGGLSIMVHANTGRPKDDHAQDSLWIGPALALHPEDLPEEDEAEGALETNTVPDRSLQV